MRLFLNVSLSKWGCLLVRFSLLFWGSRNRLSWLSQIIHLPWFRSNFSSFLRIKDVKRLYPQRLLLCPPLADHKYTRSLKNPYSRLCCQDQTMWSIMYINAWKWWAWLHSHLARNLPGSSMCNSLQSFQAMGTAMSWTQCAWRCNRSQLSLFNLILVISSMWSTYSSWLSVLWVLTFIILTFSLSWDHLCCTHHWVRALIHSMISSWVLPPRSSFPSYLSSVLETLWLTFDPRCKCQICFKWLDNLTVIRLTRSPDR